MNVGAENRTKLIVAIVLMVLAVVLVGKFLYASLSAPSAAAAPSVSDTNRAALDEPPTPPTGGHSATTGVKKPAAALKNSLDPRLRFDFLRASEDTKYEGKGRNIFRAEAEIPKIIQPVVKEQAHDNTPPPPPPPPPINLKFFGFASKPGEAKRIFLSENGDVFIAKEGDIVDRHYKVLRISPMAVEIEDVLNNNRQQIPLTQG